MRCLVLMAVLLTACSQQDRRVEMLERDLSAAVYPEDKCRIAKQIADIYLQQSNVEKYRYWSSIRDVDCLTVRMELMQQ